MGPFNRTGSVVTFGAIVGAVASRLIVTLAEFVPPNEVAWQVKVVDAVSALTVSGSQPLWSLIGLSGSSTMKLTIGLLRYQPLVPSGEAGSTTGVIAGAV
jgi:hypothetical protein